MLQVRDSGQLRYQYPESIPLLEVWLPGLRASLETVQPRAGPLLLEKMAPRHYCWDASARTDPPPARAALSWCSAALSCPLLSYSPSHVTVPVGHQTWPRTWQTDWLPNLTLDLPHHHGLAWQQERWAATSCPGGLAGQALAGRSFRLLAPWPAGHSSPHRSLTDGSGALCPARAPQHCHNGKTDCAGVLGDSKLHLLLSLTSMTLQFLNRSTTSKSLCYHWMDRDRHLSLGQLNWNSIPAINFFLEGEHISCILLLEGWHHWWKAISNLSFIYLHLKSFVCVLFLPSYALLHTIFVPNANHSHTLSYFDLGYVSEPI